MSTSSDCRTIIEQLPWLLNGSLEAAERQEAVKHLSGCARCRGELDETVEAWHLMGAHLPSLALTEYANGLTAGELEREQIERHLANCRSCRLELDMVLSDRFVDLETARGARGGGRSSQVSVKLQSRPQWRFLVVAAGLAATLVTGSLIFNLAQLDLTPPNGELEAPPLGTGVPLGLPERRDVASFRDGFESGGITAWSSSTAREPNKSPGLGRAR